MNRSKHKGKELPSLSVIHAAQAGDAEAMDCILLYYEGYINKLSTRKFHDEYGHTYEGLDEYMKRRLEIKLIHSIVTMS